MAPAVTPEQPPDFVPLRTGFPHVEIATTEGACLIIDPEHPLFAEFCRWGSEWAEVVPDNRVFRIYPDANRPPSLGPAVRGRVRGRR